VCLISLSNTNAFLFFFVSFFLAVLSYFFFLPSSLPLTDEISRKKSIASATLLSNSSARWDMLAAIVSPTRRDSQRLFSHGGDNNTPSAHQTPAVPWLDHIKVFNDYENEAEAYLRSDALPPAPPNITFVRPPPPVSKTAEKIAAFTEISKKAILTVSSVSVEDLRARENEIEQYRATKAAAELAHFRSREIDLSHREER
jgi:hypothetical protein